jgi:hypothetical protein
VVHPAGPRRAGGEGGRRGVGGGSSPEKLGGSSRPRRAAAGGGARARALAGRAGGGRRGGRAELEVGHLRWPLRSCGSQARRGCLESNAGGETGARPAVARARPGMSPANSRRPPHDPADSIPSPSRGRARWRRVVDRGRALRAAERGRVRLRLEVVSPGAALPERDPAGGGAEDQVGRPTRRRSPRRLRPCGG